jgi:hypothetical protein
MKRAEESAVGAMSKKQRLEQTDEHRRTLCL